MRYRKGNRSGDCRLTLAAGIRFTQQINEIRTERESCAPTNSSLAWQYPSCFAVPPRPGQTWVWSSTIRWTPASRGSLAPDIARSISPESALRRRSRCGFAVLASMVRWSAITLLSAKTSPSNGTLCRWTCISTVWRTRKIGRFLPRQKSKTCWKRNTARKCCAITALATPARPVRRPNGGKW